MFSRELLPGLQGCLMGRGANAVKLSLTCTAVAAWGWGGTWGAWPSVRGA